MILCLVLESLWICSCVESMPLWSLPFNFYELHVDCSRFGPLCPTRMVTGRVLLSKYEVSPPSFGDLCIVITYVQACMRDSLSGQQGGGLQ